ncbi:MAG TPA: hypothetical protein VGB76_06765 [Pyrinomonadaceae bacterium]|jgi:hypothetical protein
MEENKTTSGASAATAKDTKTEPTKAEQPIPYAKSGEVLTTWLNRRISEKGNVRVPQGTKSVLVNQLLPDGRLEVEVPDTDGATSQQQYIAFDETMFDLLLPMLAKL